MSKRDLEPPTVADVPPGDVHETQSSLRAPPPTSETTGVGGTSENNDTLLSAPTPGAEFTAEVAERLEHIEGQLTELSARLRLLEKQDLASKTSLRWVIALVFFLLLAVTWQLFGPTR